MPVILGLDIGSNSVGSAWVNTDEWQIHLGVSVFPAGVDEQENKRGAPKNQARREKRSQRRNIARRAGRKRHLRRLLTQAGLLPDKPANLQALFDTNPWQLRREGLSRPLTPHEFGRVLVHLNQRRGAVGIETDPEDPEEGKVKEGIDRLNALLRERGSQTFGQLMADLMDERRQHDPETGVAWHEPVRNRQYRIDETQQLYADRPRIQQEFSTLWDRQKTLGGPLAAILTDDLRKQLDDKDEDQTWRHRGILFGQRRTYWDTGTLGRCDLEPTERCLPLADMYAQEFRVIETVNNIRIARRGEAERTLTTEERHKVIDALRQQKTGSTATVRKALDIHKKAVKEFYSLNLERDEGREINTDWFYREIVHGVFGEPRWIQMDERGRESVNRAILKFDPDTKEHEPRLRAGAAQWWGLDAEAVDRFIAAWKSRPKLEKRLKLSRRAIRNLLPYMNAFDEENQRWPTQIEAREAFARDPNATDRTTGQPATPSQQERYALGAKPVTSADRRYIRKHEEPIPPAPMLSNPVVRKAIHEVRRHLIAWWRRFGRAPDRIVIEYVRSATQPEKVRNETLARNRRREGIRKRIIEQFDLATLSRNQQSRAVERVLLCRQQGGICAYTGDPISEKTAAEGRDVETDHIVPKSRSQDNGLNNKVLVTREANRGKGNQTLSEWMSPQQFAAMEQRLQHLDKGQGADDYFSKKDCGRKWENLHREAPTTENFLNSQFTDTAYAAKQVGQWLREVLYDGERDGQRHVLTTKGSYTSILRNDWGLSESDLDRQWHEITEPDENEGDNQSRRARKEKNKNRADHLHHAIDAVCIAFAPDELQQLAWSAQKQEIARAQLGYWPRRKALPPPWPPLPDNPTDEQFQEAVATFRQQVLAAAQQVTVSHRPVKRKITGRFHEETAYGPVAGRLPRHRTEDASTLFTNRIQATALTPNHLRVPAGWDDLSAQLDNHQSTLTEKRTIRKQLAGMPDPSPAKSGIVRDRALRDRIRKCLRAHGVNPDSFGKDDIKSLVCNGKLTMAAGIPIKSVILLRTNNDPVMIPRKRWDHLSDQIVHDTDPRTARVYIGGNNHHIEIRQNIKTGKWTGRVVTTFEAAKRNAARLRALKQAGVPTPEKWRELPHGERMRLKPVIAEINRRFPIIDRSDSETERFVMSLSEGELIYARRKDRPAEATDAVGYFVVCKLDKPARIHFAPHWDARRASEQDRWDVAPTGFKECQIEPGHPPVKVRVGPLGQITILQKD